jgi:hypothetical protein
LIFGTHGNQRLEGGFGSDTIAPSPLGDCFNVLPDGMLDIIFSNEEPDDQHRDIADRSPAKT